MSMHHIELTDDLLRTALTARAIRPGDELTSQVIDAQVLQATESIRQRSRWPSLPGLDFGRWTPVVVIALLLAALAATIAVGAALILRPEPSPLILHPSNGEILATRGSHLVVVPNPDGAPDDELHFRPVINATDIAWAPDGRRFAYAVIEGIWIVDTSEMSAWSAIAVPPDCAMPSTTSLARSPAVW